VTATREKLLDMAACFEAMGHPVAACDAREAASKLAPPAPDDAPRFKVGDWVRVRDIAWMRVGEAGEIDCVDTSDTTMPYRVVFSSSERAWFHTDELTPADSPDDEGLSEIHAALDMGAAVLRTSHMPSLAKTLDAHRAALANWAGEVERLRAELADARRYLAETERALEKKRGAFNFECSLRSTAERARLDAEKERDALRAEIANEAARLRAELAKTANERDGQTMRADAWKGSADSLRAELDEARRELETERIKNDGWHDWAWEKCPRGCDTDEKRRALIDAKLATAKAGPVVTFTADELSVARCAAAFNGSDRLKSIVEKMEKLVQARGETEVGE
jgi:hypothetical protein